MTKAWWIICWRRKSRVAIKFAVEKVEAVLAADTPVAPVYYEANATLIKPYVKGIDFTRQGALYDKNVYLLEH
ncbi:hypothetical protein DMW52_04785 [Serratia marcescens]|nr:hypothetical protein BVG96_09075 [Serratia marcescens]PYA61484.1 hypothetical protein DMW52_04785 [Serratia marcescens]PYA84342.1 hypothetical protein DMW54_20830 [Serratia marcescens]TPV67535.1 hypothetical protein FJ699_13910 [Serratia marcescens]